MSKDREKAEIASKMAQFDLMAQEIANMRNNLNNAENMHARVSQMFTDGVLKEDQNG